MSTKHVHMCFASHLNIQRLLVELVTVFSVYFDSKPKTALEF